MKMLPPEQHEPERCLANISPLWDGAETALNRLSIARIEWTEDSGLVRVQVALAGGKLLFLGESASEDPGEDRLKLVARAAAMAMENYLASRCRLMVQDLVRFNIGRYKGTLVSINFDSPDGKEQLIGTALIRKDDEEAVIRAILGTINRNILKKYGPVEEEVWNQEEPAETME